MLQCLASGRKIVYSVYAALGSNVYCFWKQDRAESLPLGFCAQISVVTPHRATYSMIPTSRHLAERCILQPRGRFPKHSLYVALLFTCMFSTYATLVLQVLLSHANTAHAALNIPGGGLRSSKDKCTDTSLASDACRRPVKKELKTAVRLKQAPTHRD